MGSWSDLRRDPATTGVFLDFDGTISAIVVDPAQAGPRPGAVDALHALARRYASVAVISGRPVAFLVDRLQLAGSQVRAYGLYGLEWAIDGVGGVHPDAAAWRPALDAVALRAEAAAPPGVGVEHKGFGVTLHVRPAPEHEPWARHFAEAEAADTGLAIHPGHYSFELRPPIAVDKGTVVGGLVADLRVAAFVGDDRGDLVAFDALDRFATDGGTAVKVGVRSDESPAELLERADEIVDGPGEVVAHLRALADLA